MQTTVPIRIYDWDFVLTDLDRHQIENLIWLNTISFADSVKAVKFEIVETYDRELGEAYQAKCHTELASGKVLETIVISAAKSDLIVAFGKRLRNDIENG